MNEVAILSAKDFTSDQEVRWCPGCGDFAILKAVRASLAEIGRAPHDVVFVSGIGCAARFPYYIDTYGFHTIHGRAPAVATGIKMSNPELDVWVVGGDGDLLSIGGNHLMHALRRDIDLNILLFNNAIYGLTKGQFSPASPPGTRSPTSPEGSTEQAVNAALLALGSGSTFVARSADTTVQHLSETMVRAHRHGGAALVEIFQNCIVYNDEVWGGLSSKSARDELAVFVAHGQPLVYGKSLDKGLRWRGEEGKFELISGAPEQVADNATVFDETHYAQAVALAGMHGDGIPTALGVLYCKPLSEDCGDGVGTVVRRLDAATLQAAVNGNAHWQVGGS